jgi:hypothetical protein
LARCNTALISGITDDREQLTENQSKVLEQMTLIFDDAPLSCDTRYFIGSIDSDVVSASA